MLRMERYSSIASCAHHLNTLAEHARTPFVDPQWITICAEMEEVSPLFYVAFEGDSPKGYVALWKVAPGVDGITVLRFVGHRVANYLEPVCLPGFEERFWRALFARVAADGGAFLDFLDISSASPSAAALELAACSFGFARVPLYPCPEATLDTDWETTFRRLVPSSKRRTELRKFASRLETLGCVEFVVIRTLEDGLGSDGLFEELAQLHRLRFRGTTNSVMTRESLSRVRALLRSVAGKGANVSLLRLDGVLVSFILGLEGRKVFIDYIPAFHPALGRFNLGHVHVMHLMRWLIARDFTKFDFSKGEAIYKRRWTDSETWNQRYLIQIDANRAEKAIAVVVEFTSRLVAWGRRNGHNARMRRVLGTFQPKGAFDQWRRAHTGGHSSRNTANYAGVFSFGCLRGLEADGLRQACDWRYEHPSSDVEMTIHRGTVKLEDPTSGATLWVEA